MMRELIVALAITVLPGCVIQTTGTLPRTGGTLPARSGDDAVPDLGGGGRWLELNPGVSYEAVAMRPSGQGWLVGKAQGNGGKAVIRHTVDGGLTWNIQDRGKLDLLAVAALGDASAVAVGRGGVVFRTEDGGARWTLQDAGTDQDLVDVAFADMSRGYALTTDGTLLATTDGGRTWSERMRTGARGMKVLRDGSALLHDDQRLMHWGPHGLAQLARVNGLASLHEVDEGGLELWALASGGRMLRSVDGGLTWDPVTSLATQDRWLRQPTALAMAFGADRRGIVLTRFGILTTLDGGRTWIEGDARLTSGWQTWLHLLEDGSALAGADGRTLWRLRP